MAKKVMKPMKASRARILLKAMKALKDIHIINCWFLNAWIKPEFGFLSVIYVCEVLGFFVARRDASRRDARGAQSQNTIVYI